MKKQIKKLTLNRETLLALDRSDLRLALGGYTAPRCQYSGRGTCETCEATCTTNFC
jgi:natural product precursor